MNSFSDVLYRFRNHERTRLLAFGSSNTEHFLPGMHWFDCLEQALNVKYGRVHTCINTGVCGDTAGKMLARFVDDAARYEPHLAIVTVGGNDSFSQNGVSRDEFRANLTEIHRRFMVLNTCVVFQTYYAPDPDQTEPLAPFYAVMDIVREVAADTGSELVDNLVRWEPFRKAHPELYKPLMKDGFHLNHRGNAVVGVDLARFFNAPILNHDLDFWAEPLRIQQMMDELAESETIDG